MLYAIFMYPDNGRECNKKRASKVGLIVGEKYEVEGICIGSSST